MPILCTICQHPQRTMIDVSLLRDGTRSTARRYDLPRSALDRHKRHIAPTLPACKVEEGGALDHQNTPLLRQVEEMIAYCRDAMIQANASGDVAGAMRASKELRAHFELKRRLQTEQQNRPAAPDMSQRHASDIRDCSRDELNRRIMILTLTLRIRVACRNLGEPETIAEPDNLKYLEERDRELQLRLEVRRLLQLSGGLAAIGTAGEVVHQIASQR